MTPRMHQGAQNDPRKTPGDLKRRPKLPPGCPRRPKTTPGAFVNFPRPPIFHNFKTEPKNKNLIHFVTLRTPLFCSSVYRGTLGVPQTTPWMPVAGPSLPLDRGLGVLE